MREALHGRPSNPYSSILWSNIQRCWLELLPKVTRIMIDIRILGQHQISRGGQVLHGLDAHPKKLALLAYLAAQPRDAFVSRDSLLAIFWPEGEEKQGRHALSQVLHHLRSVLGEAVINSRGAQHI